jgi:hypothetical protein
VTRREAASQTTLAARFAKNKNLAQAGALSNERSDVDVLAEAGFPARAPRDTPKTSARNESSQA